MGEKDLNNSLIIERHLAHRLGALAILIAVVLIMLGYFWGKKQALEEFIQHIEQESLAEQVYSSISLLYPQQYIATTEAEPELSSDAELARCAQNTQAQKIIQYLLKQGIPATVQERISMTVTGKTVPWYQITTPAYTSN